MNLYGESGNIKALKRFVERQGVECEIIFLTIGDKIDFMKYDIYYMGQGSEEAQLLVLNELYPVREQIKKSIESGKMFIATGNAMELFGKKIRIKEGKPITCLDVFTFNSNEANSRLVSDMFYVFNELPKDAGRHVIGFKNCKTNIVNNDYPRPFEFSDNIHYKHFFGVMAVGPILVKNPYFTDYLLEELFMDKGYDYKADTSLIEYKAYHEFIKNMITNRNLD